MKTGSRAFTLIELLVVISIIALLSSVVLASLNSARDKARIAAGLQFESNLYHALASEAVGVYPMEEGSGSALSDLGGGTSGSIANAAWTASTYHPSSKQALSLNGSNAFVSFPSCGVSAKLAGAPGITTSRWVYLDSLPTVGGSYVVDFLNIGQGGAMHVLMINSDGTLAIQTRSVSIDSLQALNGSTPLALGRWYHAAVSTDYVAKTISIYLDGKLDAESAATFSQPSFTPLSCLSVDRIGASPTPDRYFAGKIDNYRVFGQAF